MQVFLYVLFVLSGAAGLIYESIWSRYLSLFVGHSAYAQVIVLTIFLGGMSLGALLVGRRSRELREPLVWYAYVELAAGLLGLLFNGIFTGVTEASYNSVFPSLAGSPLLVIVKWVIAAVLILPQSVLLGTTFPLMSAGVLRIVRREPGRVLSMLYFSNSLGAAAGVLVAGFVLLSYAGLPGTLIMAGIINIVVGISALALARYVIPQIEARGDSGEAAAGGAADGAGLVAHTREVTPREAELMTPTVSAPGESVAPVEGVVAAEPSETFARADTAARLGDPRSLWRLLLAVSFGTAVASFIYEIAWIRMLSLVLGSATHSFELMLSAFILGLALGAFWVRRRADRFTDPIGALGNVQWLMGAAALATLPIYLASFEWTAALMSAVDRNDAGYSIFTLARYAFCLAVMLPSTFLAGITLPLITRTLYMSGRGETAIGTVYGVNTLGSIVGVSMAALILMPVLGVKYLLIFGAALDMALGAALLSYTGTRLSLARPRAVAAAGLLLFVVIIAGATANFDRTVLSSGVFRTGSVPVPGSRNIVFYKDGRTASVSVNRTVDTMLVISTNGKPDASLDAPWFRPRDAQPETRESLDSDISTQLLLPMITLAHAPHARLAAVIGHGSGMSSHFLLGSPVLENLYTIEIEPQMIEGSRHFMPANRRVHEDARSHHIIDDAKSYFAAANQKYDLILSEPSNPWVSGVSGLFTEEFYARMRRYLSDNGVFGQWLHLYEINDGLVLSVLAALHKSFPSYEVFQTSGGDVLIVASLMDELPPPDWSVFEFPDIVADLEHAIAFDSLTLEATRILTRDVLAPLLDEWEQPNSDFYPVLDLETERARFLREVAGGFSGIWTQGFNVSAALLARRAGPDDHQLAPMPGLGTIYSRALSARKRMGGKTSAEDSVNYPGLSEYLHRMWAFNATMLSPEPPVDWSRWALDFIGIEEEIHMGTAGFADSTFYGRVERFLERRGAPPEVHQTVRFLRGVAEWNYPDVSALADTLAVELDTGFILMSVDFVRDAGTVAKLKLGDVDGARELYNKLVGYGSRSPLHFQSRLIDAHLNAAEREKRAGGQPRTTNGGRGPNPS